jgi:BlaI family transcriptional regulator, penicillinase repressor
MSIPPDSGPLPSLGDLESDVLRLLWSLGSATAETVRAELGRPLKESTIRTVLRRLEEKGYVEHDVEGRTFVFRPKTGAADVAARGVRGLAEWIYGGSVSNLLVGLVGSTRLTDAELDELSRSIAKARDEQRG